VSRDPLDIDPKVVFRPDRIVIAPGYEHLEQLAREHLEEEARKFARWMEFMFEVDWLRDGFPRGDVY